jgi:L-lysine 6-transaminase
MCAFDLETPALRDRLKKQCYESGLIVLGCGKASIRFRPNLAVTPAEIDEGMNILWDVLKNLQAESA